MEHELTFDDIFNQMLLDGKFEIRELEFFNLLSEEEKKIKVDEFIKKHITFE